MPTGHTAKLYDGEQSFEDYALMVEQLEKSIEFDCGGSYEPSVPERLPLAEYRAELITKAAGELKRARVNLAKEAERSEQRTEWVARLRDAIAETEPVS